MTDTIETLPAIEIDADKAIALLREVVKGNEEYVYHRPRNTRGPACVYQAHGEPSCVVGKALFKAGVTADELSSMDSPIHGNTGISSVPIPERVTVTPEARQIFGAAQRRQDKGDVWGVALSDAEAMYAHIIGA